MTLTVPRVAPEAQSAATGRPVRRRWVVPLALGSWATLVVITHFWGFHLRDTGHRILLDAAPLVGIDQWRVTWRVLGAVAVAIAAVGVGPRVTASLSWRRLLIVATLGAAAWTVALALVDGWQGITAPMVTPAQYLHDVPRLHSLGTYLRDYPHILGSLAPHDRVHPPGMLFTLWTLDHVGLGGAAWAATLVIAGGVSAVAAVLVTVREVAGEHLARRAAPFVVLAPAMLWVASTADALFAGVGAWAVASVVLATGRRDRTGDLMAVGGGLLFGAVLMLSYGLVLLGLVPLVVAVARRRIRPLLLAAIGPVLTVGALGLAGFSYLEGIRITHREYYRSVAQTRPYSYFLFAAPAAFSLALGPAVIAGLARLRERRLWLLVGAALAAVAVADVSGMSKGEVERIWLPFTVWVLPAAAALGARTQETKGRWRAAAGPWLAATAGFTLLLTMGVHTAW